MSPWFVFRFHLAIQPVFVRFNFILDILFFLFVVFVKIIGFFELIGIFSKERMIPQLRKLNSLFGIDHENLFEKVLDFRSDFFELLLLCHCGLQVERRLTASSGYLGLHIMPLEWILSKEHKVKEHTQSPNINRNAIIRVTQNLRCHIFLGTTMCLCPWTAYWPCKPKISDLVSDLITVLVSVNLFQQDVFRLDISVNEVFLMNTL